MSYIGNTPANQNFVAGADQFSGTGSQTVFTLSRNVNTVFDMFVTVSNVPQDPFTAYTVAGNTLTFDSAPPSGTNNIDVVYRATNVQTFVPSPGVSPSVGNLNFIGTGNRITGDFSNATIANRLLIQNSVTNSATNLQTIPNGTATQAGFIGINNSDPTNASFVQVGVTNIDVRLVSAITGTGTYLPMTFYTNGSERARIATNGDFSFNSGYGSVAIAYGCRAWVNFNGTGTVAIRASGNVSSITDNGTGLYTVNFTNALVDTNYNTVYGGMQDNASATVGYFVGILTSGGAISTKTTSALAIHCKNQSGSSADGVDINVSVFR